MGMYRLPVRLSAYFTLETDGRTSIGLVIEICTKINWARRPEGLQASALSSFSKGSEFDLNSRHFVKNKKVIKYLQLRAVDSNGHKYRNAVNIEHTGDMI
jgi:hypothetical protein